MNVIDARADAEGNVELRQATTYPRAAFEEFLAEVELWTGTLEEYFAESIAGADASAGTSYDYAIHDTTVQFLVTLVLGQANGDAAWMGFSVQDDFIVAAIDSRNVQGVERLTLTTPGRIVEANGRASANTVTWDADAIASQETLTARGEREPSETERSPLVMLIPLGAVLVLAGVYIGFLHRPRTAPVESVDVGAGEEAADS